MIATLTALRTWASTAAAGDYLARYEDSGDDVSDPGSRCGYSDEQLHAMREVLGERGRRLESDDVGLRVVVRL